MAYKDRKLGQFEELRGLQQGEEERIQTSREHHALDSNMKRNALDEHIAAQAYSAGKTKNIIRKLISDRNDCFQIRVVENTFMAWKNFTQDKRRVMKRVAALMAKSFRQVGFDAVREVDWTHRTAARKEYVVTKIFNLYTHRELLQAFHNWKTSNFTQVT